VIQGTANYGSVEWLENRFKRGEEDPWGLQRRAVELVRYDRTMELLQRQQPSTPAAVSPLRILDVGCATGYFTNRLRQLGGNVLGIDLSEIAVQRARRAFHDINFQQASVHDKDFVPSSFDLISCSEVLYYVERDAREHFLAAISNLLKDHGTVLFTSVVGPPPYFQATELTALASGQFDIKRVAHYGCALWSRVERRIWGLSVQARRLNALLNLAAGAAFREIANAGAPTQKKYLASIAVRAAAKARIIKYAFQVVLLILETLLSVLLRWKFPAILFNFLAEKLDLVRTHTLVIAAKRESYVTHAG